MIWVCPVLPRVDWFPLFWIDGSRVKRRSSPRTSLSRFLITCEACRLSELFFNISLSYLAISSSSLSFLEVNINVVSHS